MSKPKTVEQWLNQKDLPTELGRVFEKQPWEHNLVAGIGSAHYTHCRKCLESVKDMPKREEFPDLDPLDRVPLYGCSVPDPITIDLSKALERFRTFTRNELFEPMLDIARPHQPGGEFADMPVDQMLEIAERYCLREASARELWIICAMAMERKEE